MLFRFFRGMLPVGLLLLWTFAPCWGAEPGAVAKKAAGGGPMVIHSNSLEADNASKTITFTGDVEAVRDEFTIHCQKMVVHYLRAADSGGTAQQQPMEGSSIDKIVAKGSVQIDRAQGGTATSEEAVYYEKEGKVVLTGNPVLKQETDTVEGEKVVFYINDDRVVVEGSQNKRVKAVVFPKSDRQ